MRELHRLAVEIALRKRDAVPRVGRGIIIYLLVQGLLRYEYELRRRQTDDFALGEYDRRALASEHYFTRVVDVRLTAEAGNSGVVRGVIHREPDAVEPHETVYADLYFHHFGSPPQSLYHFLIDLSIMYPNLISDFPNMD